MPNRKKEVAKTVIVDRDGAQAVTERELTDEERAQQDEHQALQAFLDNENPTSAQRDEVLKLLVHRVLHGRE